MKPLYSIRGKVKKGAHRGRLLGFPTANMNLQQRIPEGVYIAEVVLGGVRYPAATFIGSAKTYGETDYKVESYILDFDQDVYGKWISVLLLQKLRGNKKFSSETALITQIKQDILQTRMFFRIS